MMPCASSDNARDSSSRIKTRAVILAKMACSSIPKRTNGIKRDIMNRNLKPRARCDYKIRYLEVSKAIAAADSYMDRITLTNAPMQPYYCKYHACWHIGHDRTKNTHYNHQYQTECVARHRLRGLIQGLNQALIGIGDELEIAA